MVHNLFNCLCCVLFECDGSQLRDLDIFHSEVYPQDKEMILGIPLISKVVLLKVQIVPGFCPSLSLNSVHEQTQSKS